MPEDPIQRASKFGLLLRSGGTPWLAVGILLTLIGLVLLTQPRHRSTAVAYAIVALIPGIAAAYMVWAAYDDFCKMAMSNEAIKPAQLAAAVSRGMAAGFFGLMATLVPMAISIGILCRVQPEPDPITQHG